MGNRTKVDSFMFEFHVFYLNRLVFTHCCIIIDTFPASAVFKSTYPECCIMFDRVLLYVRLASALFESTEKWVENLVFNVLDYVRL